MNFTWLENPTHIVMLVGMFLLSFIVYVAARVYDLLDEFHDDYRKVNSLDEREAMEMEIEMDANIARNMYKDSK